MAAEGSRTKDVNYLGWKTLDPSFTSCVTFDTQHRRSRPQVLIAKWLKTTVQILMQLLRGIHQSSA